MTDANWKSGLLSGSKLHVEDSGGIRRPVVFIHGWPMSGGSCSEQVSVIRDADYRVITYDRRGFGESQLPPGGFDYDRLADDLASVLDDLDVADATLVGFGMGGGEIARYLARHGDARVRSVVFASSVTPFLLAGDDNPEGSLTEKAFDTLRDRIANGRTDVFEFVANECFTVDGEVVGSDVQRKAVIAAAEEAEKEAVLGCLDSWATTDFRTDLEAVSVPALVVHGLDDVMIPFEGSGARTHQMVEHSELVTIDRAPHAANQTHPEAFNDALLSFLAH